MEHGLIRLINSGGTSDAGFTQTIAVSVGNRLYRVTNNARTVLGFTINSVFDLTAGRSVDVFGSTLSVVALDTLQLFGTYDTI